MAEKKVVFIAVHPHNAYGIYDRDKNYAKKRDERLSDLRLEHLLLIDQPNISPQEHKPDIAATAEKVDLNNSYWRGRIFLTHSGQYASAYESDEQLDFQQLSNRIRERYPAERYVFWGAELHRPPANLESKNLLLRTIWEQKKNEPYGCVIFYHNTLNLPHKIIEESHCYILDG